LENRTFQCRALIRIDAWHVLQLPLLPQLCYPEAAMMTRDELRKALHNRLEACDAVLAMWEAGSVAFDRADERSDLDIGVLAGADSLKTVWQAVDRAPDDVGGFSIRWENPVHIFKGMTQRIYRPKRGRRWLDLDIGIFQDTAEDLYLQPQRHGRATILFDRSEGTRTANARSSTARIRSGSCRESEWLAPDWLVSGATTHTSSESSAAIWRSACRPGESIPSSLVRRMRIEELYRAKLTPLQWEGVGSSE
jgi:predicted nucleotidyltransferase